MEMELVKNRSALIVGPVAVVLSATVLSPWRNSVFHRTSVAVAAHITVCTFYAEYNHACCIAPMYISLSRQSDAMPSSTHGRVIRYLK
jgi:hypothetical protein